MTSTYQMVRELGWPYLEKLAQQQVLQIQSATDTPKKIVLGERPLMADGNKSNVLLLKETGGPIEVVYATEGTPSIVQPSAIFASARIRMLRDFSRTICSVWKGRSFSSTWAPCVRCMRW